MVSFGRQENVIVKLSLPAAGVACSNPQRCGRLVANFLEKARTHTDSWGIEIQTGIYRGQEVFVAAVPMGAGGSGFAFLELFAAGAEYIVRYGSNDRQVSPENLREIYLVDEADNLYGLLRDSGLPEEIWGQPLWASSVLITTLQQQATRLNCPVQLALCHHLEDYHAFNFPECAGEAGKRVRAHHQTLAQGNAKPSVWDMETAALFWRAQQFERHGATVLQSLIKHRGEQSPYEGDYGQIAMAMERTFGQLILDSLIAVLENP